MVRVEELSFLMSCLKIVHTEEEVQEILRMHGEEQGDQMRL
jgi:hypothetical protein